MFAATSSVNALINETSDIASSAEAPHYRHNQYGYLGFPFCRDPLAVIVNEENPISDLAEEQLRAVFRGGIVNWSNLGGPDRPIVVVVPGTNTAAYYNVSRMAIKTRRIA